MDAQVTWKINQPSPVPMDQLPNVIQVLLRCLRHLFNFMWRKAKDLAEFADDRPMLKSTVSCQECDLSVASKPFENVTRDIIPVLPGEINVKIRWVLSE